VELQLHELDDPQLTAGRVLAQHRGAWLVGREDGSSLMAPTRGRLYRTETGAPVTGDWVAIDANGAIAAVLPRAGCVTRFAPGKVTESQLLAAHVDLCLVVEPLPDPNPDRAERLAALARAGGVRPGLLLTKHDLAAEGHMLAADLGQRLGVEVSLAISALVGGGLETVRDLMEPGTTTLLLGPSGVGKSTLINALLGSERQATQPVRLGDGRGRHTTVSRELIALPTGALVMDTPGIRSAGLWDGTGESFADIAELAAGCRFADCAHDGEPGCAVAPNVDAGRLSAWRKLEREQALVDDRKAAALKRDQADRSYRPEGRAAQRRKDDW